MIVTDVHRFSTPAQDVKNTQKSAYSSAKLLPQAKDFVTFSHASTTTAPPKQPRLALKVKESLAPLLSRIKEQRRLKQLQAGLQLLKEKVRNSETMQKLQKKLAQSNTTSTPPTHYKH